ncbi:ATP-grasp domain-containing protein [Verrucomicrobiaceae bacterium N1E253]|uniref:ATP-grasp domain-containing protein n=2 Tax=Oceaniferula marina TaxID=2748318 RepID=A0A851GIT2_9BACT|nr:ATP-grasp domain-containing protein [Oceaniferula marina]
MITQAYIEESGNGKLRHESALVAEEMKARGIPYKTFTVKKIYRRQLPLDSMTLVVGDMDCMYGALKQLGIDIPPNNDYPKSLSHLLHRKVWTTTLGAVKESFLNSGVPVFIKPAGRKKVFTGFVCEDSNDLYRCLGVSRKEPVYCSEIVSWVSEFRVYVSNSQILGVDFYRGDDSKSIDITVVEQAIKDLDQASESYAGYAIDFGVLSSGETALVEMNDGFSVGAYSIDKSKYTDMTISRWEELLSYKI